MERVGVQEQPAASSSLFRNDLSECLRFLRRGRRSSVNMSTAAAGIYSLDTYYACRSQMNHGPWSMVHGLWVHENQTDSFLESG